MSGVTSTSVAPIVAIGAKNTAFAASVKNVEQRTAIIGTALAAKTGTYVANKAKRLSSAAQAGALYGFGSPIHMAARYFEKGQGGSLSTPLYAIPQAEAATGVAAAGTLAITHVATASGTLSLRIAGELFDVGVTADMTTTEIGAAIVARLAEYPECLVTGVNTTGSVALTAKGKGTYGNDIAITLNDLAGEETPAGVTYTITAMTGGLNDPEIDDALEGMGVGDLANSDFFTRIIPCYGRLVAGTMASLSEYNGTANEDEGCWARTVGRPFTALFGDTVEGSDGLDDLLTIADAQGELNRTCGVIAVSGASNHPTAVAAMATGIMANMSNDHAEATPNGKNMPGIIVRQSADSWTANYATGRDTAEKVGISPTKLVNGVVKMQHLLTFYHPDSVAIGSNGHRSMRNINVTTNIVDNVRAHFESDNWKDIEIVDDVTTVDDLGARERARDLNSVMGALFALLDLFQGKGWLFSAAWSKEKIGGDVASYIALRAGGGGFDFKLPLIYSGEGGIVNGEVQFDTNLSVVTG
ncbi:MAG: hypothetical protein ABFD77_09470 [Thermotogota bacterium]